MDAGHPSRTARAAAAHRAVHQVLEQGAIFSDPLAIRILGADAEDAIRDASADPAARPLRLFIAVRSRFAEDALAAAMGRGVRQVVVLGAGLDTSAYRHAAGADARIFEVDHPATQVWKRQCLAAAGIEPPPTLTFVPVDFAREALGVALERAGFAADRRTFFTWLGVVPYLAEGSVLETLRFVAGHAAGADIVFDYANPLSAAASNRRAAFHEALAERVASAGEPFRSYFETRRLLATLAKLGFANVEDLGPDQIRARYFPNRPASGSNEGGHLVHAATPH
jgi:methyltransferase (TIGR00027 family)